MKIRLNLMACLRLSRCAIVAIIAMLHAETASAAPFKNDEQVVFIPSIGSRPAPSGTWILDVHAWAFEPEGRTFGLFAFRKSLGLDKDEMTSEELRLFEDRARWFMVDNERHKAISIWIDHKIQSLGMTEADGQLHTTLSVSTEQMERMQKEMQTPVIAFTMANSGAGLRTFRGEIHLIDGPGLSVISDIDDTIKISEVRDQKALLRNTFTKPFQAVGGMAEAYRRWGTNDAAQFHYVSASPIQLYVPLSEFVATHRFPAGTFHLKKFRWKDEHFFSLFISPEEYKPAVIEPILDRFPERKFVLVGDSGEKDPEIYARLAMKFRSQIHRILIRDVTDEAADGARYQKVFGGLPPAMWQVFKEPSELPASFKSAP